MIVSIAINGGFILLCLYFLAKSYLKRRNQDPPQTAGEDVERALQTERLTSASNSPAILNLQSSPPPSAPPEEDNVRLRL